jgi:tetratricopeptide (TPR) repeat protein
MSRRGSRAAWILPAILVLTTLVYAPSFRNAFLNWDDPVNVTQNAAIRVVTAENLRVWFTEPLLGMYSPMVYASFAIDYAVGGREPAVYHATNLALHLSCVLLVFGIIRRLTGHELAAAIAAGLFAVHPALVAAVTPISVRSSLLYSAFYLGAYLASLSPGPERPGNRRLLLVFILFVLAGLSKSAAVVFPVLLILTDWYRRGRLTVASVLEKLPFVLAAIVLGFVTLHFRTDAGDALRSSMLDRLMLAMYQVGFYVWHTTAPYPLSPFYPYPEQMDGAMQVASLLSPIFVAALAVAIARSRSLRRPLVFGALFFLLHLALVLKLVPLGEEFTADRYLYLPVVGLCVALVEVTGRWPAARQRRAALASAVVIATFAGLSYARQMDWRDDLAFNNAILERFPRTSTALANRGAARLQAGDIEGAWHDSSDAIRSDPRNARAYHNRATAGMLSGRPAEALADVSKAIILDPRQSSAFELRAQAHLNNGSYALARDDAARAIALAPAADDVFKSYVTRSLALAMMNDGPGALSDIDRAIALNPSEPALLQNRGQIRIRFGDTANGCADLREAARRGRQDAQALVKSLCSG